MLARFIALLLLFPMPAQAADGCYAPADARVISKDERIIDLPQATKAARAKVKGEVVSANLCRVNQRLVYVLTFLTPEGRVVRISVDAANGAPSQMR